MIALLISTLLVMPLASPAQSQDAPAANSDTAISGERAGDSNNEAARNRVVCRSERISGSNRSERVCMTAREREVRRADARDARDMRDDNRGDGRRYDTSEDAASPK